MLYRKVSMSILKKIYRNHFPSKEICCWKCGRKLEEGAYVFPNVRGLKKCPKYYCKECIESSYIEVSEEEDSSEWVFDSERQVWILEGL